MSVVRGLSPRRRAGGDDAALAVRGRGARRSDRPRRSSTCRRPSRACSDQGRGARCTAGGAVLPAGDPRQAAIVAWIDGTRRRRRGRPRPRAAAATGAPSAAPAAACRWPPLPRRRLRRAAGRSRARRPGPRRFRSGSCSTAASTSTTSAGISPAIRSRRTSVNALRSYHHFLFLSHDAAGDPCGLSVEILTLQFWEAHCRVPGLPAPLAADRGGRKDRRPVRRRSALSPELRRPGRLRSAGAAADLGDGRRGRPPRSSRGASSCSPTISSSCAATRSPTPTRSSTCRATSRPTTTSSSAGGNRLGAAWRFVSAWYSAYFNPLGFGRRLFMQAFDLTIWRPRAHPGAAALQPRRGPAARRRLGRRPGRGRRRPRLLPLRRLPPASLLPDRLALPPVPHGAAHLQQPARRRLDNSRLTTPTARRTTSRVVARYRGLTAGISTSSTSRRSTRSRTTSSA